MFLFGITNGCLLTKKKANLTSGEEYGCYSVHSVWFYLGVEWEIQYLHCLYHAFIKYSTSSYFSLWI